VIDDGSTDETAKTAAEHGANVISHTENRGYGAALKSGIAQATAEFVVFCDGDGQHRREDLLKLIEAMPRFDMVIGVRKGGYRDWVKEPGRLILGSFVNYLLRKKVADFNSGLRAFRTSVIRGCLNLMPDGFSFSTTSTVAMYKLGYRVHEVPVEVNKRQGRKSSVRIFRDGARIFMLILHLAVLFEPQRVFLPASLLFVFSSLVYFLVYSVQIRIHVTASMVMLFLTGVLLFFLGVVCEQISAIRREIGRKS